MPPNSGAIASASIVWRYARVAESSRSNAYHAASNGVETVITEPISGRVNPTAEEWTVKGTAQVTSGNVARVDLEVYAGEVLALLGYYMLVRAPQVIIELHPGETPPSTVVQKERAVWSLLPSVPAVRTGRVHLLYGGYLLAAGPRLARAAESLARVLHPDTFAEADLEVRPQR